MKQLFMLKLSYCIILTFLMVSKLPAQEKDTILCFKYKIIDKKEKKKKFYDSNERINLKHHRIILVDSASWMKYYKFIPNAPIRSGYYGTFKFVLKGDSFINLRVLDKQKSWEELIFLNLKDSSFFSFEFENQILSPDKVIIRNYQVKRMDAESSKNYEFLFTQRFYSSHSNTLSFTVFIDKEKLVLSKISYFHNGKLYYELIRCDLSKKDLKLLKKIKT